MSNLLERTMHVQAISYGGDFTIQLYEQEMKSTSFMTAITLDSFKVEFEAPKQTQADFHQMKSEQLTELKAQIMKNAEDQCKALGGDL